MAHVCGPRAGGVSVLQKRRTEPWRYVHEIADRMSVRVRKAFLEAVKEAARKIPITDISEAVKNGDVQRVLELVEPADQFLVKRLKGGEFVDALQSTYTQAGAETGMQVSTYLPKAREAGGFRFDMVNPRSVDFLQKYDGDLITNMTKDTRQSIITIVQEGYKSGFGIREMRKLIVDNPYFGLTEPLNKAVFNYANTLKSTGVKPDRWGSLVDAYHSKLLKYRAEMIARTETIRAAEMGRHESWRQAADAGLFDPDEAVRTWIITPDDRLCDFCRGVREINKNGVPFDQEFRTPDGYFVRTPPAHPHCRCSVGIKFGEED